jgi:hypothetical protein
MKSEVSLPCSERAATGPYPEQDASSPHLPHCISLRYILVLSSHLCLGCQTKFWAMGLMIGGFDTRQELGIFFFTNASRPSLEPTQPPIQRVPGAL